MARTKQIVKCPTKGPIDGDTTHVDKTHLRTLMDLIAAILESYGTIDTASTDDATPGDGQRFYRLQQSVFQLCDARQSYHPAVMLMAAKEISVLTTSAATCSSQKATRDAVYADTLSSGPLLTP